MTDKKIWNDNHQKLYKRLYTKLKDTYPNIQEENYIKTLSKTSIKNFINKLDLSNSSKESFFFMVARYMDINLPEHTTISTFKQSGYNLKVKREKQDKNNELDEKEKKNFKEYDYYKQILDNIKYDDIKDKKSHYEYLLLSLLVLHPPLRSGVYVSSIIQEKGKINDIDNYLILTNIKGLKGAYFYINNDKVSNTKSYSSDIIKNSIQVENKQLINILIDSYNKYPRKYLFENNGKPITQETLLRYLRNITKIEQVNIDMMRSMYITYEYNKGISYNQKEQLSLKMRNSVETSSKNYYKILDKPKARDEEIINLKNEINKLKIENLDLRNKLNLYEPNIKLYTKRRADVLFRLRNGQALKQSTIDKYKITETEINENKKQ